MKIEVVAMACLTCGLTLFVAPTSGQLLNQLGQVWNEGDSHGAKYIEIQVTKASETEFSGVASFKANGAWIAQEQSFKGTQQELQGGIVLVNASCGDGTMFSGWLFPGSTPGTNSDDRLCLYFTGGNENQLPCAPAGDDRNGVLQPTTSP